MYLNGCGNGYELWQQHEKMTDRISKSEETVAAYKPVNLKIPNSLRHKLGRNCCATRLPT